VLGSVSILPVFENLAFLQKTILRTTPTPSSRITPPTIPTTIGMMGVLLPPPALGETVGMGTVPGGRLTPVLDGLLDGIPTTGFVVGIGPVIGGTIEVEGDVNVDIGIIVVVGVGLTVVIEGMVVVGGAEVVCGGGVVGTLMNLLTTEVNPEDEICPPPNRMVSFAAPAPRLVTLSVSTKVVHRSVLAS